MCVWGGGGGGERGAHGEAPLHPVAEELRERSLVDVLEELRRVQRRRAPVQHRRAIRRHGPRRAAPVRKDPTHRAALAQLGLGRLDVKLLAEPQRGPHSLGGLGRLQSGEPEVAEQAARLAAAGVDKGAPRRPLELRAQLISQLLQRRQLGLAARPARVAAVLGVRLRGSSSRRVSSATARLLDCCLPLSIRPLLYGRLLPCRGAAALRDAQLLPGRGAARNLRPGGARESSASRAEQRCGGRTCTTTRRPSSISTCMAWPGTTPGGMVTMAAYSTGRFGRRRGERGGDGEAGAAAGAAAATAGAGMPLGGGGGSRSAPADTRQQSAAARMSGCVMRLRAPVM